MTTTLRGVLVRVGVGVAVTVAVDVTVTVTVGVGALAGAADRVADEQPVVSVTATAAARRERIIEPFKLGSQRTVRRRSVTDGCRTVAADSRIRPSSRMRLAPYDLGRCLMADYDPPEDLLQMRRDFLTAQRRLSELGRAMPSEAAVRAQEAEPPTEEQRQVWWAAHEESRRLAGEIDRHSWWGEVDDRKAARKALDAAATPQA